MRRLSPLFALLLLFSSSPSQADAPVLRLHGSNTVGASLAPALVEAWMARKGITDVQRLPQGAEQLLLVGRDQWGQRFSVEIHAHGSSTAFADLGAGQADLGMSSRPVKAAEVATLAPLGRLDRPGAEYVLGLDGIAVIVHRDNPLTTLDTEQVRRIFTGEVRDWAQVGGRPGPIRLYARDDKSGTFDTFKSLVLGKTPLHGQAQRFESNAELSDHVAADPAGIGFTGLPYVRSARALAVAERGTRPIVPQAFSVATEDYALARRLFLYLPERVARPEAREFAEFAVSPAGQAIVEAEGFVAQAIHAGAVEHDEQVPDEYATLTDGAQRLSVNFRFRSGSTELDTKAWRDVERLVAFMEQEENAGRRLMLYGFADADEALPLYSLELSVYRADLVANLLLKKGLRPVRVRGYGAAVPVAANDSSHGQYKNRRVEVWIR